LYAGLSALGVIDICVIDICDPGLPDADRSPQCGTTDEEDVGKAIVARGVCDGKLGGVSEGVFRVDNSVDVVVVPACESPSSPPPKPTFPGGVRACALRGGRFVSTEPCERPRITSLALNPSLSPFPPMPSLRLRPCPSSPQAEVQVRGLRGAYSASRRGEILMDEDPEEVPSDPLHSWSDAPPPCASSSNPPSPSSTAPPPLPSPPAPPPPPSRIAPAGALSHRILPSAS